MRCPKCGYFSFDYLAECGKCGLSLSEAKEKLGLIAIKPSVPFFLGSLLKDGAPPAGVADDWDGQASSPTTALSEIEFGEDYDLDIGPAEAEAVGENSSRSTDSEFSLFDLGVPELQEEIHGVRSGSGSTPAQMKPAHGAESVISPTPTRMDASSGKADSSRTDSSEELEEGLILDLSDDDFDEKTKVQDGRPAVGSPSETATVRVGGTDLDSTATAPLALDDNIPHDLVLELDDEDMDRPGREKVDSAVSSAGPDLRSREMKEGRLSLEMDSEGRASEGVGGGAAGIIAERATPTGGGTPTSDREEQVIEFVEEDIGAADAIQAEQKLPKLGVATLAETDAERTEVGAKGRGGARGEAAEHADDMVIELSDDDIEVILTGLEEIGEDNGQVSRKTSGSSDRKKE